MTKPRVVMDDDIEDAAKAIAEAKGMDWLRIPEKARIDQAAYVWIRPDYRNAARAALESFTHAPVECGENEHN
jgi:hypothetical protein